MARRPNDEGIMSLLLLHGALGSSRQMAPLQALVGGVAIDLTGHGAHAAECGRMSFDAFVEDIERAYAKNRWEQADLFGYSMGGYAALLFAAKHPEKVRSVVTLGTKYLWTDEGLARELRMLDPDRMLEKVPAFAEALASMHGEYWRDVVGAIAHSMKELAASPLLTPERCARITCPVLCLVGDGDATAIPEDTGRFAAGLPRARHQILQGVKHPFETVDLEVLSQILRRFRDADGAA